MPTPAGLSSTLTDTKALDPAEYRRLTHAHEGAQAMGRAYEITIASRPACRTFAPAQSQLCRAGRATARVGFPGRARLGCERKSDKPGRAWEAVEACRSLAHDGHLFARMGVRQGWMTSPFKTAFINVHEGLPTAPGYVWDDGHFLPRDHEAGRSAGGALNAGNPFLRAHEGA